MPPKYIDINILPPTSPNDYKIGVPGTARVTFGGYRLGAPVGVSSASTVNAVGAVPDEVIITSDRDGETIPTGTSYTWEIKPVVYPGSYSYHPNTVPVTLTSISKRKRIYLDYWIDDSLPLFNSSRTTLVWDNGLESTTIYSGGGNPYGGIWSHIRIRGVTQDSLIYLRAYNAIAQCFAQDGVLQLTPSILVTLTAANPIRYTTNGATPTLASPLYTAPFDVSDVGTTVVKAATVVGGVIGTVKTASYTIPAPVAAGDLPYVAW